MVSDYASVPTLLMLGACSRSHYIRTRLHIHKRSRNVVRPFVRNPDHLFLLLKWTDSIISGSTALRFMIPSTQIAWVPHDLDIYVTRQALPIIMSFLRKEGFSELRTDTSSAASNVSDTETDPDTNTTSESDYSNGTRSIALVVKMVKDHLTVDVIQSMNTPISAVIRFHSTAVMNYITGQGFLSAYPTITDQNRSLINPLAFYPCLLPPSRFFPCVAKYAERGITTCITPLDWDNETTNTISQSSTLPGNKRHQCHISSDCPHTIRSNLDNGCLFVKFGSSHIFPDPEPISPTMLDVKARAGSAVWNIGGVKCYTSNAALRPFVVSDTPEYSSLFLFFDASH